MKTLKKENSIDLLKSAKTKGGAPSLVLAIQKDLDGNIVSYRGEVEVQGASGKIEAIPMIWNKQGIAIPNNSLSLTDLVVEEEF